MSEVDLHPDLKRARRGGVRMVTQLLNRKETDLVIQSISALEEMLSSTYDESFAGMDGYNSVISLSKNAESKELRLKALKFLRKLPTPLKMDVDGNGIDGLLNALMSEKDEEIKSLIVDGIARIAVYEDWSAGLILRANLLNKVLDLLKKSPSQNYHLLHLIAALSDLDEVKGISSEDGLVIANTFKECCIKHPDLLTPITTLVGRLGSKIPLKLSPEMLQAFLTSSSDKVRESANQLLMIMGEHDRKTIAESIPTILGLLSKPDLVLSALRLLSSFSIYSAITVVMVEKSAIKVLLSIINSSSYPEEVKDLALSILKRIVEEPENKMKIVAQGQLGELLKSLDTESSSELLSALSFDTFCKSGNLPIEIAKQLLSSGADPSINDNVSIAYACGNGQENLVDLLLSDSRVNPAANNNAALRRAGSKGYTPIVQKLLKDPRVDPTASGNWTIVAACENGHYEIFKLLFTDPRVDVQPSILFEAAIKGGNMDICQELMKLPNIESELANCNILTLAIQFNRREFVESILVSEQLIGIIDPSQYDNQTIIWASRNGYSEIVDLLLYDSRVDPTAKDNNALRQAVENGHKDVVDTLLKDHRCDPSFDENWLLRCACTKGSTEIVRLLLDDPRVDPSAQDNIAIRIAAKKGYDTIIDDLLAHDLVDPSDNKNEAIINAATEGHTDIVRMLCSDKRVDPSARYNTALKVACHGGFLRMVELLLNDERVDPSVGTLEIVKKALDDETITDKESLWKKFAIQYALNHNHSKVVTLIETDPRASPAFLWNYAVNNKNVDFVKLLLNDERIKNVHIKNAFSVASKNGDFDIMELLLQADNCDISLKEVGKSIATGFSMMRKKIDQIEIFMEEVILSQDKTQKKIDAVIDLMLDKEERDKEKN